MENIIGYSILGAMLVTFAYLLLFKIPKAMDIFGEDHK
jgi:hypothetical protein